MKVTPVASKHAIQQTQSTTTGDTRAKVVANLNAKMLQNAGIQAPVNPAQSQETAVLNPNAVSVEELGAITQRTQAQDTDNTEVTSDNQTVTEATAEVPAKQVDPEFQKLASREKAMRALAIKQQTELKQKDQDLQSKIQQAKEEAVRETEAKYQGHIPKEQLKANAMQILADAGVSYDDLTQQILNQQTENPQVTAKMNRLEAMIQKQTEIIEKFSTTQNEEKQQNYKAAINQIQLDVDSLVKTDPSYEMIKNTNSARTVTKLIEATWKEEGRVMDVEEAAERVENHLTNKYEKIFTSTSKIKERLAKAGVQSQAKQQQTQTVATQQQTPMKTLTNATASTRKLSSKERAILAFKGQLKS